MRRLALGLVVIASGMAACVGDGGDCGGGAPLTAVVESAAAERATSCVPALEFGGTTYIQYDCEASVRRSLLGPAVARNAGHIARSIEGVPTRTALAIRERLKKLEGCRGWLLWVDGDQDDRQINKLARRVNRSDSVE